MSELERRLAALSPAQRRLYRSRLEQRERAGARSAGPARTRDGPGPHPLSFSQERFWFLSQLEPDSAESNMAGVGRFRGALDVAAMRGALGDLLARHEVLRTTFPDVDGVPGQHVAPPGAPELALEDLAELPVERRESELRERARSFACTPFDLARGPLARFLLLRIGPQDHALCVGQHHAVSDGWSLWILMSELSAAYNARVRGRPPELPELALRYADCAEWQRRRIAGEHLQRLLSFWREALDGAPRTLELPTDRPRPPRSSHAGATLRFELDAKRVRAFAAARGATPFEVLLAAFQAFLGRLCDVEQVVLGTSVAGRERPEFAGLMGPFVNTLVLRTSLAGRPTFAEILGRARRASRAAAAHAELPFELLVGELAPERDPGRTPLFNVFFDMAVPYGAPAWHGLEFEELEFERGVAQFDLALSFEERGEVLRATFEYDTDLFERESVQRLRANLETFLAAALAAPEVPWMELDWIATEERALLEHGFQPQPREGDAHDFVQRRFERRAAQAPESVAIEDGPRHVTYAELESAANRWAHLLIAAGAGADERVAVCLPRSSAALAVLLGIWKAGAAYLPLDHQDPPARIAERLAEARPVALVTDAAGAARMAAESAPVARVLRVDDPPRELHTQLATPPDVRTEPGHLAYLLYTSGSTGRPKGVAVDHGALVNHLDWVREAFDLSAADRFLLRTPFTFDASLWEIVHPLTAGATLVVAGEDVGLDARTLLALAARARISVAQTVPSLLRVWLEEPTFRDWTSLRHLVCGGEALGADLWRAYRATARQAELRALLHNLYGPSEACIDATACTLDPARSELRRAQAPIGRPIRNTRAYVLDRERKAVPIGAVGELWLCGAGLARGYWNDPERTAASFVRLDGERGRAYRTGDLARWLPGGELEFAGRVDRQVKLRGVRVEPGEIESRLREHAAVLDAAVVVVESPGGPRLEAFCALREGRRTEPHELRAHLARSLPTAMLPGAVHVLEALPRNASEKVDYPALACHATGLQRASGARTPPATELERTLAEAFAELLGVSDVVCEDDFFALGGHSLLAARLIARLREEHGLPIDLAGFFEGPSVGALGERLRAAGRGPPAVERGPRPSPPGSDGPLSFFQERLLFLQRLDPASVDHNVTGALRLRGPLDENALRGAWSRVLERHEILRSTIGVGGSAVVHAQPFAELERIELEPGCDLERAARAHLGREAARAFDLERGPLVRLALLSAEGGAHALCLNLHHLVADGWSLELLVGELAQAYSAARAGRPDGLRELPYQHRDWARWQREAMTPERLAAQLAHWRTVLDGAPPRMELPWDRARVASARLRGARVRFDLGRELTGALQHLARELEVPLYPVLLAGFAATLARTGAGDDLVLGSVVAQRPRPEFERLIGPLLNALPLRLDLTGPAGLAELARRTARVANAAWAHQEIPFDVLVRELSPVRNRDAFPLFQVSCDLASFPAAAARFEGLECEPIEFDAGTAKLDLALAFELREGSLRGVLEYAADRFDAGTVRDLARHLARLLEAGVREPECDVRELPMDPAVDDTPAVERSEVAAHAAETVLERFEAHARTRPDAPAIEASGTAWSYGELDARAEAWARRLSAAGVQSEQIVGLCLERSPQAFALLLGVWKLGAAWLQLDPDDPEPRRAELAREAGCALIVSARAPKDLADGPASVGPLRGARPGDLAYVVATSGSTGRPKLVAVEQGALAHHTRAAQARYAFAATDRVVQTIALGFDAALLEFASAFAAGACLSIAPPSCVRDPRALVRFLAEERISVAVLPAALLGAAAELGDWRAVRDLRLCLSGGEALPPAVPARLFQALDPERVALYDSYGPSETCIEVTSHRCGPSEPARVPIGRELAGVRVRALDPLGRALPPGLAGELAIGGPSLFRGYLGREDLTRAACVDDPLRTGERLYRSGDLARRRADGEWVLLGRVDDEIKVAGRRLRPGAIEEVLNAAPGVCASAVEARRGAGDELHLVAHVVFAEQASASFEPLERHARARLPHGWVPRRWRALESLPRNAHGKLDRAVLARVPDAEFAAAAVAPAAAPRSELERELARRFGELLGCEPPGVHDDFFALGGGSLAAMRLIAGLVEERGVALELGRFYDEPTVAALARALVHAEPSTPALDLEAEVARRLDFPRSIPRHRARTRARVLLTGATGFLGAFLLEALLERGAERVTCVVRADGDARALGRLRSALRERGLAGTLPLERVEVLAGDLGEPRLGLSERTWARLGDELDGIVHCGAVVHFFERYERLAGPNVDGTRSLLELAVRRGLAFHYVSTLGVIGSAAARREVLEDDPLPDASELVWGYERSKWVAERLVAEAGARGLPVTIHRPGRVAGHSRTGVWNSDDLAARLIAGVVELGAVPELDARIDVTPVDWVAQGIAHLCALEPVGRVYHFAHPEPTPFGAVFARLRARGHALEGLEYGRWLDVARAAVRERPGHPLAPLLALVGDAADPARLLPDLSLPRLGRHNLERDVIAAGLSCPAIDAQVLDRWIDYLERARAPVAASLPRGLT